MEKQKSSPYHTYQVPNYLWKKLSRKAESRTKKTGKFISWTMILREVLDKKFMKKKK